MKNYKIPFHTFIQVSLTFSNFLIKSQFPARNARNAEGTNCEQISCINMIPVTACHVSHRNVTKCDKLEQITSSWLMVAPGNVRLALLVAPDADEQLGPTLSRLMFQDSWSLLDQDNICNTLFIQLVPIYQGANFISRLVHIIRGLDRSQSVINVHSDVFRQS